MEGDRITSYNVCYTKLLRIYFQSLNSHKLFFEILPTWFILPVIAFILSFLIGKYIYKPIRKRGYTISKKLNDNYILKGLVVFMSMYVAFSIGTNNVANAVGPIATMAANELDIAAKYSIHVMILATLIVAPSFGIGSSFFGHKIVQKTGREIVLFGRIEAAIIAFISASLLLTASVITSYSIHYTKLYESNCHYYKSSVIMDMSSNVSNTILKLHDKFEAIIV